MKKQESKEKPLIFSYKDAHLNDIIEPEDYLKFFESPLYKEKLDGCLNEIR